jgi:hypothetical protein
MQRLRGGYVNLITSGSHLLLLLVAARINEAPVWAGCFALISAIGFIAWVSSFRRGRAIADTPTSRIASAAQGYVEIYGRASNDAQFHVQAKNGSFPCVWFRCTTYRRNADNKWQEIDHSVSDSIFEIQDGSGHCMVDPEHAEVITTHSRTWYEGDYKHVEEQLLSSDSIYVLGEFNTVGGANNPLSREEDVRALLAEWKKDQSSLLKRFDLDQDGEIDLQEWELARRAAIREVEKQHRELRQHPGVHVMRRPASGRLYLLSNLSPQQVKRKYTWWGWFHLATFFAGLAMAIWFGLV